MKNVKRLICFAVFIAFASITIMSPLGCSIFNPDAGSNDKLFGFAMLLATIGWEGARGATVVASNESTTKIATVDAEGYYEFKSIEKATYNITPTLPGYSFDPPSQTVNYTGGIVSAEVFYGTPN